MLYYIYSIYYWLFPQPILVCNPNSLAQTMRTSVTIVRNNILTPTVQEDKFLIELKQRLSSDNQGLRRTFLLDNIKHGIQDQEN